MKLLSILFAATSMITSSGCIYSNFRMPVSRDFRNTNKVCKNGKSTSRSVAWIAAWGNGGLQAAAEEGDLKTLEYVDVQYKNILFGLYLSRTTIVYGQ